MNTAFQISQEDLRVVLMANNIPHTDDYVEKMFEKFITPESDRIEKAALYGNDINEQTEYAHDEICKILCEKKVIRKGRRYFLIIHEYNGDYEYKHKVLVTVTGNDRPDRVARHWARHWYGNKARVSRSDKDKFIHQFSDVITEVEEMKRMTEEEYQVVKKFVSEI